MYYCGSSGSAHPGLFNRAAKRFPDGGSWLDSGESSYTHTRNPGDSELNWKREWLAVDGRVNFSDSIPASSFGRRKTALNRVG